MSLADDAVFPVVSLNVSVGRGHLWEKLQKALRYLYRHHLNDADWFFKADDDTYVIVENLRRLLVDYDPRRPFYLGCRFAPLVKQGYMSGGAGYALSREALRLLVEKGLTNSSACNLNPLNSDVRIGECLEKLGVNATDTRDSKGRHRLLPDNPWNVMKKPNSYHYYRQEKGEACCSDRTISFHYVHHEQMQVLDFLIYGLRPVGFGPTNEHR